MKICQNCGAQMDDKAMFCTTCGAPWSAPAMKAPDMNDGGYQNYYQGGAAYGPMPFDHTDEFTQQDIHDNKVFCLAIYLMGVVGILIGLLGSKESPYVAFHIRQSLKITVAQTLTGILSGVLFWTIIAPLVGGVFIAILFVVRIICFVRVCSGKAIEPPIVRSIGFLN